MVQSRQITWLALFITKYYRFEVISTAGDFVTPVAPTRSGAIHMYLEKGSREPFAKSNFLEYRASFHSFSQMKRREACQVGDAAYDARLFSLDLGGVASVENASVVTAPRSTSLDFEFFISGRKSLTAHCVVLRWSGQRDATRCDATTYLLKT